MIEVVVGIFFYLKINCYLFSLSNTLNVPTYTLAGLGGISGTGTTNYIPKFTSSSAIGNSILQESGGTLVSTGRYVVNTSSSKSFNVGVDSNDQNK